jgi:hypothetical protein
LPFRDLVNDPRLLQRPGAVQKLRLDEAELAGVETAEAANGGDGPSSCSGNIFDFIKLLFGGIKYIATGKN